MFKNFEKIAVFLLVVTVVSLLVLSTGCEGQKESSGVEPSAKPSEEKAEEPKEETAARDKITVYFADSGAQYLVPFEYSVGSEEDKAAAVIDRIFSNEAPEGYLNVAPVDMKKPQVKIEGDTAVVDLDADTISFYPKGSTGENLFIYSIVNSLIDSTGVKSVKFTVGGKSVYVEGSNYDFSDAVFEYKEDIVKK